MPDLRALFILMCLGAVQIPVAAAEGITPDHAARLERLVTQDCGSCHGLTLKGGLGRPLTTEALDGVDRETLATIILDGLPGTAMPPWRALMTEAEAYWISDYLLKDTTQ